MFRIGQGIVDADNILPKKSNINAQTANEYNINMNRGERNKKIIKKEKKNEKQKYIYVYPEIKSIGHEIWVFINVTNK